MPDLADETAGMDVLSSLRRAKHFAFVGRKRARRRYKRAKFDSATRLFRNNDLRPWRFRADRYANTFLRHDGLPTEPSCLPEQVFALWTGDNALTANRARNLAYLRERLNVPLILVTTDNLSDWVVPNHPVHPAYDRLSLVHRADYLRGYLMHHHGGGYVDIKSPLGPWNDVFLEMRCDPQAWVTGYRTTHADWIGKLPGRLGVDILVRYRLLFGKGAFVMRSHTPLTAEWMDEMHRRLDEAALQLSISPEPGVFAGGDGYPFGWTDLLGKVLDPLTLKYHKHIRFDDRLLLNFTDYR